MELKSTLTDRKFIKNTKPNVNDVLPKFTDGLPPTGPINFANPAYQRLGKFDFNNPVGDAMAFDGLARDAAPVSISGMSKDIIDNRLNELKEVPLKEPRKSKLPKGKGLNLENLGGAILAGINFAGTMDNIWNTSLTKDLLIADAGTSEGSVAGISYNKINPIKYSNGKLPKYSDGLGMDALNGAGSGLALGASVGSIIPGIGTAVGGVVGAGLGAIGGIFGNQRRKIKEAEMKRKADAYRVNFNNFSRDGAMSEYLQQREAEDMSEPMYSDGKLPKYEGGKPALVDTAYGMMYGVPNAKVEKNEIIKNTITGAEHKVKRGPNDTALAYIQPSDMILPLKNGAAAYYEKTGDLVGAASMIKGNYSEGKLPAFAEGWLPNALISGLGGLAGLTQYIDAKNQNIKRANTYSSNKYTNRILQGLAGLQYNPYPVYNSLNNLRARTDYALDNSGGLSGSQRYLGRIANANNMYNQYAGALANMQKENIGLRSSYYNTMANLGENAAKNRQQANQWDLDYYSKAHAARQQQMQTGVYNMLNSAYSWYANDFKRRQFNDTMALYREDQKIDWEKIKRGIG